jgi:hypothetical protein
MYRLSARFILLCLIFANLCAGRARANNSLPLMLNAPTDAPKKHALLVGVSEYERGKAGEEWWNLNSGPDVEAMHKVLVEKFGFKESEIKILRTKQETTHKSIVDNFRSFIIEQTQPGDIVYFHYSGHGGQVPDTNTPDNPLVGDELDGFDECLIPSDYVSKNDGSNNLRDDELGNLLDELKKKRPANVTLSFDSCFSGTITRGGRHKARDQKWEGPQPSTPATPPKNSVVEKGSGGLLKRGEAVASGYVLITATRNNQVDTETNDENGQEMGPLSYALSRAFSKAGPQTTYRDIFESVNETMNRMSNDQNPQLEGDMDKLLMNGTALPPQPYIPISVDAKGKITLQAGEVQGMTSVSRLALFSNETKDFKSAQPKAEAEIIKLDLTSATLKLIDESIAKGAKPQDLQAARAVETSHQYGDNRLKVYIHNPESLDQAKETAAKLNALPLINTATSAKDLWDVRLCAGQCPDQKPSPTDSKNTGPETIVLQRQDGSLIAAIPAGPSQLEKIRDALDGESRWRFVNTLANKDPVSKIQIALRLVPVEVQLNDAGEIVKWMGNREAKMTDGGQFELAEDDYVNIELKNDGEKDAFVTVLDLLNDGTIRPIWPYPGIKVQENRIPADKKWHRLPQSPYTFRTDC